MLLHHLVTCVLIYFSYIANLGAVGAMIAYLHYIADIFVAGAKCFNEMEGTLIPAVFMALVQISWAYTRLYVFPFIIYSCYFIDLSKMGFENPELIKWVFISFLCVLLILHWFWYIMISTISYNTITKGAREDIGLFDNEEAKRKAEKLKL